MVTFSVCAEMPPWFREDLTSSILHTYRSAESLATSCGVTCGHYLLVVFPLQQVLSYSKDSRRRAKYVWLFISLYNMNGGLTEVLVGIKPYFLVKEVRGQLGLWDIPRAASRLSPQTAVPLSHLAVVLGARAEGELICQSKGFCGIQGLQKFCSTQRLIQKGEKDQQNVFQRYYSNSHHYDVLYKQKWAPHICPWKTS